MGEIITRHKRIWLFGILCILILNFSSLPLKAANSSSISYLSQAKVLQELGLFSGTSYGFELERYSTRAEASVMLVRILGQEKNIQPDTPCVFQDVADWAAPYVQFLYEENIVFGISQELFGAEESITPEQYMTYLLRILGYIDTQGDFNWEESLEKALELGIIQSGDIINLSQENELSRGGMVNLSYQTLFATFKEDPEITLLEKLYLNDGAITKEQLLSVASYNAKVAEIVQKLGIPNENQTIISNQEIARRVSPAVFYLITYDENDLPLQSGSGFFIESDGVAVTNYHVIQGAYQAQIQTNDGSIYDVEGVLSYDMNLDLALLQIKGKGFDVVECGNSDTLETGEKVYSISSPLGLANTFSEGIVSNACRWMDSVPYIQMTVPISSGSSGGVLLNSKAQAIGIITAIAQDGQSLNFALPINLLLHLPERHFQSLEEIYSVEQMSIQRNQEGIYYEKENNNIWALANFLNGPTTVVGNIDYWNNDMDYFSIITIMPGKVQLELLTDSGEEDSLALALVRINDEGNTEGIAFADYVTTSNGMCEYRLQYDLQEPGTYYIVVYPYKKKAEEPGEIENYLLDYQIYNTSGY